MLLKVCNLSKQYKRNNQYFNAVDYINFSMNDTEMVSLFGQSGSGKSTLLNMIVGILQPTSGTILLDGEDIIEKSRNELAWLRNKKIGYVMQGQNLLSNFTILDNVCMPCYLSREKENEIKRKNYKEKAIQLLLEVGLEGVEEAYPNELSGGELRRVSIARALIQEPKLLIADEPTSNLDSENALRIIKVFQKIKEKKVAVLISTHDSNFLTYSDQSYNIKQGKLSKLQA